MEATNQLSFINVLLPFAGIAFIIGIGAILINQQFRKKLQDEMLKQEELKSQHQMNMLRSSIQAQDLERKRIAQDLHDQLGANLSIARMQLVQLKESYSENKVLEAALLNVQLATEASIASMRRISHQLMPPQLERFGLVTTMETVAAQLNAASDKLKMDVMAENIDRFPTHIELSLYRVCLELVNNTIKHASASQIHLIFQKPTPQLLLVEYNDNGQGISDFGFGISAGTTSEIRNRKSEIPPGLGLINLEAHIHALQGTVNFGNRIEGGFFVRMEIPV